MQFVKSILRFLALCTIGLVLVFEEWGWEPLAAAFGRLARLPLWARLEAWISGLRPVGAVCAFATPFVALLPVKLLALYLFAHGHYVVGLALLLGAKLLGTAVLARLFQLTQPALMQIPVYARWYPRWKAWKDDIVKQVKASALWLAGKRMVLAARTQWQRMNPFK